MDARSKPISPLPKDAPAPGTLLEEMPAEPGSLLSAFPAEPPEDAESMRAYLKAYLAQSGSEEPNDYRAGDYAFALVTLMQTWTLSDAAQRAAPGPRARHAAISGVA